MTTSTVDNTVKQDDPLEEAISCRFQNLTIGTPTKSTPTTYPNPNPNPNPLQEALRQTPFTIFQNIVDYGYFGWRPRGTYRKIGTATTQDIQAMIDFTSKPSRLVDTQCIPLPLKFHSTNQMKRQLVSNKFPHDIPHIASLHVLAVDRRIDSDSDSDLDLSSSFDFMLGGSVLSVLANPTLRNTTRDGNYVVVQIPTTNIIMIRKYKVYQCNYADPGFQLERLVTGSKMKDRHELHYVEHLQTMSVGPFQVLFSADVDALQLQQEQLQQEQLQQEQEQLQRNVVGEGEEEEESAHNNTAETAAVEIKSSHPRNWGTKLLFQMISSGSTQLLHGVKTKVERRKKDNPGNNNNDSSVSDSNDRGGGGGRGGGGRGGGRGRGRGRGEPKKRIKERKPPTHEQELTKLEFYSLPHLVRRSMPPNTRRNVQEQVMELETSIVNNLGAIQKEVLQYPPGTVLKIMIDDKSNKGLRLQRAPKNWDVLPSQEVIRELLVPVAQK